MTKTSSQLEKLTEAIEKLLNKEVAPVAPVLPIAPVAPVLPIVQQNSGDHDLLTKLDTKVDAIQTTVNKLSERDNEYLLKTDFTSHLKDHLILRDDVDKLKDITSRMWSYGIAALFVIGLIEFALRFIIK